MSATVAPAPPRITTSDGLLVFGGQKSTYRRAESIVPNAGKYRVALTKNFGNVTVIALTNCDHVSNTNESKTHKLQKSISSLRITAENAGYIATCTVTVSENSSIYSFVIDSRQLGTSSRDSRYALIFQKKIPLALRRDSQSNNDSGLRYCTSSVPIALSDESGRSYQTIAVADESSSSTSSHPTAAANPVPLVAAEGHTGTSSVAAAAGSLTVTRMNSFMGSSGVLVLAPGHSVGTAGNASSARSTMHGSPATAAIAGAGNGSPMITSLSLASSSGLSGHSTAHSNSSASSAVAASSALIVSVAPSTAAPAGSSTPPANGTAPNPGCCASCVVM